MALVADLMMMGGGEKFLERGVALIAVVFLLGIFALLLVLLFPRQREVGAPSDRLMIGAEGEAVQP